MTGALQEGFSSEMLGGPGADFLRREIFRLAKMISRDRCSTSYDLASLFRGRRGTLDRWSEKIRKTHWHEAVSSARNFTFLKEVSQNCFVFDAANFEN